MLLEKLECEELTDLGDQVVDSARRVFQRLGAEHPREAYLAALCQELDAREISYRREVWLADTLHGMPLNTGYVLDLEVGGRLLISVVAASQTAHEDSARLLTMLHLSGQHLGYVVNFAARNFEEAVRQVYYDAKPVCPGV